MPCNLVRHFHDLQFHVRHFQQQCKQFKFNYCFCWFPCIFLLLYTLANSANKDFRWCHSVHTRVRTIVRKVQTISAHNSLSTHCKSANLRFCRRRFQDHVCNASVRVVGEQSNNCLFFYNCAFIICVAVINWRSSVGRSVGGICCVMVQPLDHTRRCPVAAAQESPSRQLPFLRRRRSATQ